CVTTSLHQEGGLALVELNVTDNGPGFPETMIDRLFEPYATTRPKGSGLGLAIVKKIVEEHGGVVTATNVQEQWAMELTSAPALTAPDENPLQSQTNPASDTIEARAPAVTGARIMIRLPQDTPELESPEPNASGESLTPMAALAAPAEAPEAETVPAAHRSGHNIPQDLFRTAQVAFVPHAKPAEAPGANLLPGGDLHNLAADTLNHRPIAPKPIEPMSSAEKP
ncbi:MAG: ATP-binding protein, partial [Halothiobacillus sp.]